LIFLSLLRRVFTLFTKVEGENLAPSNVEYDLIDDILYTFSDAVCEFIKGNDDND